MALTTARKANINTGIALLWTYLPDWMARPANFRQLAGRMRVAPTHRTYVPHDAEEVEGDGLDDTIEFNDQEEDLANQTGTDEFGNPIYGTKRVRGEAIRAFFQSVPAGTDREDIKTLFKRTKAVMYTVDGRTDLTKKVKFGWFIHFHAKDSSAVEWVKSKGEGFQSAKNTYAWKKVG